MIVSIASNEARRIDVSEMTKFEANADNSGAAECDAKLESTL
jgi:hypothetical protein